MMATFNKFCNNNALMTYLIQEFGNIVNIVVNDKPHTFVRIVFFHIGQTVLLELSHNFFYFL